MKPYYTRCACHREIGMTDGAVLIVAGMQIRRSVTFWCMCGVSTPWVPSKAPEKRAVEFQTSPLLTT
jgi:hypothetical protein